MSLIVQKFGGSSVRDYAHLLRMARIVKSRVDEGNDVVVVLSAQGDTTDGLLQKAREISEQPSPRELDMLLSAGEQMSAALGAMTLRSIGVEAVSLCAWQIPIETDGTHGNAEIELIDTARIRKELAEGRVVVAAGFQGVDENSEVTTLGRGGSDTSAVALAAALKANELVIYTDVDGIFSSDPRICQNAVRREVISYDDMLLLAQKGAQVLHDRSVALAQAGGVPITVRSCREGGNGSVVCETDEDAGVVGVTQKKSDRSRLAAITAVGGALPSIEKEKIAVTALERAEITVFAVAAGERFMRARLAARARRADRRERMKKDPLEHPTGLAFCKLLILRRSAFSPFRSWSNSGPLQRRCSRSISACRGPSRAPWPAPRENRGGSHGSRI